MPEFQKSFQIDPEGERDKYRAYDLGIFWNDTDKLEKLSEPTELDSLVIKFRDQNARVFANKGPKAYVITDTERMDELDYAHQAMKFHGESDPRIQQIVDQFLQALLEKDSKVLEDFFCGQKNINLDVAIDSLPAMDFARKAFSQEVSSSRLGKQQKEHYYERKSWLDNVFKYKIHHLLLDSLFESPFFDKLKSSRENKYGVEWANIIGFTTIKYSISEDKITLQLSAYKYSAKEMPKSAMSKNGEMYIVDSSKDVSSTLRALISAYSRSSKICLVKIKGPKLKKAKILFDEIRRLDDLNTEDSHRQALTLQDSIGFYIESPYKREKVKSNSFETKVEWMIEGEKVEQELKIEGFGHALDKYGTEISKKIEKDGMTFLLTNLRNGREVSECVFYVIRDGVLYPRLAYKSRSHKRWRIDTFIGGENLRGKGEFSYTTETVPFIELDDALENLEKDSLVLERGVDRGRFFDADEKSIHTYLDEVERDLPVLYDFAGFSTNHFPHNPKEVDDLMNPDYIPDDFIPDFTGEPLEVRHREKVTIEHYHHTFRGIELDFHIARDEDGRVWVDRLEKTLKAGDLTSYGTRKKSLEFGPLSMKPFDYAEQVAALNPNDEVYISSLQTHLSGRIMPNPERPIQAVHTMGSDYADITPFFDQLKLIQKYREQRGIRRNV